MATVGGRNINVFVGVFTATATWVGETYINGTAEIFYLPSKGFLWVQAPVGFTLSLVIVKEKSPTDVNMNQAWKDIASIANVLGRIPWQTYFQRVLSAAWTGQARLISYLSGFGCFALAIPSVFIAAVTVSTDWNQTSYGLPNRFKRGESVMILPLVLHYLCLAYISIAGLGAIAAATMSSAGSALLSAGSMFTHNIYRKILRKKLCCALFTPSANTYGLVAGLLFGLLLRLLAGEPALSIPPAICYPACSLVNRTYNQLFHFKTFTMLLTLGTILAVSYLAKVLFQRNLIPHRWDVCNITGGTSTITPLQQMEK